MKLITTIILALFADTGFAVASERIDSLSYAYGHQYTLATMAGKNDMMQTEEDFRDFIRGLEDNIGNLRQMADSSYMVSYCIGAMEAVFMTDGMHMQLYFLEHYLTLPHYIICKLSFFC